MAMAFTSYTDNIYYNNLLKVIMPSGVPLIDVNDLKEMDNCTLLDAREKVEFDISHIDKSIWVGYKTFSIENIAYINRNETLIVYCSVGWRSGKVAQKLIANGYSSVYNLYGGIFEWVNCGNKVYNCNGPTNNLHVLSSFWGVWVNNCNKIV